MPANLPGTQRWQIKSDDRRRGYIVKMAEEKAFDAWAAFNRKQFNSPEEAFFTFLNEVDDAAMRLGATRDDHRHASVAFERLWTHYGGVIPGDEPEQVTSITFDERERVAASHGDLGVQILQAIHGEIEKFADARGHIRRLYIADDCARQIFAAIEAAGFVILKREGAVSDA